MEPVPVEIHRPHRRRCFEVNRRTGSVAQVVDLGDHAGPAFIDLGLSGFEARHLGLKLDCIHLQTLAGGIAGPGQLFIVFQGGVVSSDDTPGLVEITQFCDQSPRLADESETKDLDLGGEGLTLEIRGPLGDAPLAAPWETLGEARRKTLRSDPRLRRQDKRRDLSRRIGELAYGGRSGTRRRHPGLELGDSGVAIEYFGQEIPDTGVGQVLDDEIGRSRFDFRRLSIGSTADGHGRQQ